MESLTCEFVWQKGCLRVILAHVMIWPLHLHFGVNNSRKEVRAFFYGFKNAYLPRKLQRSA